MYEVVIESRKQLKAIGVCKGKVLKLQNITIVEDCLPLLLGSTDVILGIKWLATLGETRDDWKNLTICFELGGQTIVLRGDPILTKALVSLKIMVKELLNEKEGLKVELFNVEGVKTDEEIDLGIEEVIQEFNNVFGIRWVTTNSRP